jgi:hypothetical protein
MLLPLKLLLLLQLLAVVMIVVGGLAVVVVMVMVVAHTRLIVACSWLCVLACVRSCGFVSLLTADAHALI